MAQLRWGTSGHERAGTGEWAQGSGHLGGGVEQRRGVRERVDQAAHELAGEERGHGGGAAAGQQAVEQLEAQRLPSPDTRSISAMRVFDQCAFDQCAFDLGAWAVGSVCPPQGE